VKRYEVYFLQEKLGSTWETLERAQSASVLVSLLTDRLTDPSETPLRIVAGSWDQDAEAWDYAQLFFVDRGTVDLNLAPPVPGDSLFDDDAGGFGGDLDRPEERETDRAGFDPFAAARALDPNRNEGPDRNDGPADPPGYDARDDDRDWDRDWDRDPAPEDRPDAAPHEVDPERRDMPGGNDFAAAIRRARGDAAERDRESPVDFRHDEESAFEDSDPTLVNESGLNRQDPFADTGYGRETGPVGPPPAFNRPPQRRRGSLAIILLLVAALVVVAVGAVALMVALDLPEIRPYVQKIEQLLDGGSSNGETMRGGDAPEVQPETTGQVLSVPGVAGDLRGRWSAGDCEESYVQFETNGYVIKQADGAPSVEIPVQETLMDDYTVYVRRSPILVEHYQVLSADEIQAIGATDRQGFHRNVRDILSRCP